MFRLWILLSIFSLATGWLYFLTQIAPEVQTKNQLGFPSNLQELQDLADLLQQYYHKNAFYVVVLFSSAYLYKQSFSIPGSVFMNVLGGALFGVVIGFPLCCALTGAGASGCFLLSKYVGRDAIRQWFPDKVRYLELEVQKNSHRLIYYLLFLRLFPMSPNWLINLTSPVIGIPYPLFVVSATIGLMPYNFVCVQAGEMLASLTSLDRIFSFSMLAKMALLALVALGPSLLIRRKPTAHTAW